MTGQQPPEFPRLLDQEEIASDANSSVQVYLDNLSNRGRSTAVTPRTPSRQPSNSGTPEPRLGRPAATSNPLSSFLSPSGPQQQHQDRARTEDLLRDLISANTNPDSTSNDRLLHGLKRSHEDDSSGDEPLAKRDKLGEELEEMMAAAGRLQQEQEPTPSAQGSVPDDAGIIGIAGGLRTVLPIRGGSVRQQQPQQRQQQPTLSHQNNQPNTPLLPTDGTPGPSSHPPTRRLSSASSSTSRSR